MIKQEKEADFNKITAIHDRIDDFKDPDKMMNKIKSEIFDLKD